MVDREGFLPGFPTCFPASYEFLVCSTLHGAYFYSCKDRLEKLVSALELLTVWGGRTTYEIVHFSTIESAVFELGA